MTNARDKPQLCLWQLFCLLAWPFFILWLFKEQGLYPSGQSLASDIPGTQGKGAGPGFSSGAATSERGAAPRTPGALERGFLMGTGSIFLRNKSLSGLSRGVMDTGGGGGALGLVPAPPSPGKAPCAPAQLQLAQRY